MKTKLFALAILATVSAKPAFAEPCDAMIRDLVSHAAKPNANGVAYGVRFNMSTMKRPGAWIGVIVNGYLDASGTSLKNTAQAQYFSDRLENFHHFAKSKYDRTTVEIAANGQIKYVLNTWGNYTQTFNTTCSNGFMYATAGDLFHVLSFNKVAETIIL